MNIHRSSEATPGDRGRGLGRAQRDAIANTAAVYVRLFSEDVGLEMDEVLRRGHRVAEQLQAVRPDLVEEIAGIAAGASQPEALVAALNARTELLAGGALARGGGECSVAGMISRAESRCLLGQNWDFHPDLARSRLVWRVELPGGFWFTTFTEAGLVGKTGLNAAGIGVALNFLAADADGGTGGLPVHVLLRTILDSCRDPGAAGPLLAQATVQSSACITVADGDTLCSYELSPRGTEAVHADEHGLLAHTNHFLRSPRARDLIVEGPGARSSVSRLAQVQAGLRELDPRDPVSGMAALLSTERTEDGAEPVFRRDTTQGPWLERCATLATLVYDLGQRRMWIRTDPDPRAPLVEVLL
jgi:isopenicillin-N N-acyltransferase-like protein